MTIIGQIWINTLDLLKQSFVLPIIASAFLSVITADIAREMPSVHFFIKFWNNDFTELLDIGLHYIFAFLLASLILFIIYLLFSIVIII